MWQFEGEQGSRPDLLDAALDEFDAEVGPLNEISPLSLTCKPPLCEWVSDTWRDSSRPSKAQDKGQDPLICWMLHSTSSMPR